MTEEEAKDKWCPMAMNNPNEWNIKCQGSQCMAWVWDTHPDYLDEYNPKAKGHCGMVK